MSRPVPKPTIATVTLNEVLPFLTQRYFVYDLLSMLFSQRYVLLRVFLSKGTQARGLTKYLSQRHDVGNQCIVDLYAKQF